MNRHDLRLLQSIRGYPAVSILLPTGVMDDAVDEIIEMALAKGGRAVFVDNGALADYKRIALTLRY